MSDDSLKTKALAAGFDSPDEKGPPVRAGDPRKAKAPEPVVFDQEAFSIAKDKDGRFFLVTLKYDLATGKAEIVEKLEQGSRSEAFERFKIKVVHSSALGS